MRGIFCLIFVVFLQTCAGYSTYSITVVCVLCVCFIPFTMDVRLEDVPAEVTQEEGHTGFLHFTSAVLALIFLARRIQPFLSLVNREVECCVLTTS